MLRLRRIRGRGLAIALALMALACKRDPLTSPQPAPSASNASPAPRAAAAPIAPPGYVKMRVGGVFETRGGGNVVLLARDDKRIGVPIYVSGTEALSIQLRHKGARFKRPLTHDLMDDALSRLDAKVLAARVDKLEDQTFHGTVILKSPDGRWELDARPSDAIALALGASAPIFVARAVVDHASVSFDEVRIESEDPKAKPPGQPRSAPITL